MQKTKILMLSDHPLCASGVGVQSQFLISGLLKTGKYTFRCLGGAVKHPNYDTQVVNADFLIKPVDGFGNKEMLRQLLITEKPDVLLLFTDPRQFIWVWEMEDEIRQVCPIAYWHVWDNAPYPNFNKPWYDATDLINCLSHKTFELVQPHYPDKTNYIPHAFPNEIYYPLPQSQIVEMRKQNFGDKADWFIGLWINRNAHRKMPSDVLVAWKQFLDELEAKEGHRNGLMIMHTDPTDGEGPNLYAVNEQLGLQDNVVFSTEKHDFASMNALHNMVDFNISLSKAEGFGLSSLSSLMVGKPVLLLKTGGMTRQVVDHRTGEEMGVAIEPIHRSMVGSQLVPFIMEDFAGTKDVVAGLHKLYSMTAEEKETLSLKMRDYAQYEFGYGAMIKKWDESLTSVVTKFKTKKIRRWELVEVAPRKETK